MNVPKGTEKESQAMQEARARELAELRGGRQFGWIAEQVRHL